MKLTHEEIASATWSRIRTHLTEHLADLRAKNDANLSPEETARMRGRIFEIKQFLALEQPAPELVVNE